MKIFAERLKNLRIEKEISARKLAEILQVTDTSIARWENEEADIKGQHLVRIARFFNVSTDYLLGITNRKEPYED